MITVVASLKGGTGKSTVTFNLAVWLCSTGVEVKVIDLDPQKTLTDFAILRMADGIEPVVHVQSELSADGHAFADNLETLIDVGTANIESFKQALGIADRVLIPVTPSQADVWSTQRFVQFVQKIERDDPPELLVLINRADTDESLPDTDETAAALQSLQGVRLLPQRLSDRSVFGHAFSGGAAVFEAYPESRGSTEFEALAAALFSRRAHAVEGPDEMESRSPVEDSADHHDLPASLLDRVVRRAAEYDEGGDDDAAVAVPASRQDIEEDVAPPMDDTEAALVHPTQAFNITESPTEIMQEWQIEQDEWGRKDKKGKKRKQDKKSKKRKKEKKGKKSKKGKKGKNDYY